MAVKRKSLRSQDIVVLFTLLTLRHSNWVVAEVANLACLSLSETHASLRRLELSGFMSAMTRKPIINASKEFLLHGLKYVFPAEPGGRLTRGIPTAHSAPALRDKIIGDDNVYIWPCPYGKVRGIPVIPLYRTVPDAIQKNADLYEFLALVDAMCVGRSRERDVATDLLIEKLNSAGEHQ